MELFSLRKLEFPRFRSFRFWQILENWEIFPWLVKLREFVLLEEVVNFRGFRVFYFGPYTEIENLENSEIFLRLVKLKVQ